MAQFGIRIRDATGAITVAPGYRMGRYGGVMAVSSPGSLTDPIFAQGQWFADGTPTNGRTGVGINFSMNGTTLSWSFTTSTGDAPNLYTYIIEWGVY